MFLNYVPIFLCGSKVTIIIRYQKIFTFEIIFEKSSYTNKCKGVSPVKIEFFSPTKRRAGRPYKVIVFFFDLLCACQVKNS